MDITLYSGYFRQTSVSRAKSLTLFSPFDFCPIPVEIDSYMFHSMSNVEVTYFGTPYPIHAPAAAMTSYFEISQILSGGLPHAIQPDPYTLVVGGEWGLLLFNFAA